MTDEVETNRTQNVADLLEMRSRGYRELAEYRANAAEVLGGILERAGSFRHADAAEIQSAAADLVDAVYRYPDALLCLSDLHNFDPSTHQHCVNTAALSVLIARRLGLPRQEVLEIAIGALLHDLGKLTVPLSILRFPGKLSAAAWDVMKQHALQGAEIGAAYDNLSPASLAIPLLHHERADGRGYPFHLRAGQIHTYAALVAVTDTYDALTTPRPYRARSPLPPEGVARIIAERDSAFIPRFVDAFVAELGIYPPGTCLELNTGDCGVVLTSPPDSPHRPTVSIVVGADGRRLSQPRIVELHREGAELSIARLLSPAQLGIPAERAAGLA